MSFYYPPCVLVLIGVIKSHYALPRRILSIGRRRRLPSMPAIESTEYCEKVWLYWHWRFRRFCSFPELPEVDVELLNGAPHDYWLLSLSLSQLNMDQRLLFSLQFGDWSRSLFTQNNGYALLIYWGIFCDGLKTFLCAILSLKEIN